MATSGAAKPSEEFALGRIAALQPRMSRDDLGEKVMATEDPLVFNNLANVIRLWGHGRKDLPDDFAEQLKVMSVSRQPLALVVAEVQRVERTLTEIDEPFAGGPVDSSRWKTDDLFDLLPIQPTLFPKAPLNDESIIPGREEVSECSACDGAGDHLCAQCGGAGTQLCPACSGTRQVVCERCGGAGTHIGVSGREVQCQMCRTRGVLTCHACQAGQVVCTGCSRRGRIQCSTCAGHGNLCRKFMLITDTKTESRERHSIAESWPIKVERLIQEADLVEEIQWPWPATNKPVPPLETKLPRQLLPSAVELCQEVVRDATEVDAARERITGVRLRVLGTYLYQVDFECVGRAGRIFVGGNRCRVFCQAAPTESTSLFRAVGRLAKRAFHALQTDDRPGLDAAYVNAVLGGKAHIADSRCLVPEAAKQAEAGLHVTETGYRLDFDHNGAPLTIDVELDMDEHDVILRAAHVLGPAHRDQFPKALALTSDLSFGRLAVMKGSDGRDVFALMDRRLYTVAVDHLAWILRAVADEARELRKRTILS